MHCFLFSCKETVGNPEENVWCGGPAKRAGNRSVSECRVRPRLAWRQRVHIPDKILRISCSHAISHKLSLMSWTVHKPAHCISRCYCVGWLASERGLLSSPCRILVRMLKVLFYLFLLPLPSVAGPAVVVYLALKRLGLKVQLEISKLRCE